MFSNHTFYYKITKDEAEADIELQHKYFTTKEGEDTGNGTQQFDTFEFIFKILLITQVLWVLQQFNKLIIKMF
jgi:hypothetical protein